MSILTRQEIAVIVILGTILFLFSSPHKDTYVANINNTNNTAWPWPGDGAVINTSVIYNLTNTSIYENASLKGVLDLAVCKDHNINNICEKGIYPNSTTAYLYWRVKDGVGCCNTYNCNYDVFKVACLYPDFKLYSVAIDGKMQNINFNDYEYSCTTDIPWNWFKLTNLSIGAHVATVVQRDCHNDIANRSIMFRVEIINGVKILTQRVIE
jgi:hypothetical protein